MAESVLQAPSAPTKTHNAITLLDAYQDGRITREELLDHLLEWRKDTPAKPATSDADDTLSEIHTMIMNVNLALEAAEDSFHTGAFGRGAGVLFCAMAMAKNAEDLISERAGQ